MVKKQKWKRRKVSARIFEQSRGKYEVRISHKKRLVHRAFAVNPVSKAKAKKYAKKVRAGKTSSIF